jgi:FkbM family methyltransferase
MKNTDAVIQRGVGKGLRFNAGASNASYLLGTAERDIQKFLQLWLRPGMIVYDVGANVGFVTIIAAQLVGETGRVCAFEPVSALADQALRNAELNHFRQVSVYRAALSDQDGTAPFELSANLTMGKLVEREAGQVAYQSGLWVKRNRLDTMIATESLPDPDLIKIDVEGGEAAVLDGAVEVLRCARPVLLIELHGTNEAVAGRLERMGFSRSVLGSGVSIKNEPPDATLIAVPEERGFVLNQLSALGLVQ